MTGFPDDRSPAPDPPGDGDLTGRLDGDGRPDPLEPLLHPPATFLTPPPGAFDRIRRRAARRRRTRTVAGLAGAATVLAGALYIAGALPADDGGEAIGPPAKETLTSATAGTPTPSASPTRSAPTTGPAPSQRESTGPSRRPSASASGTPGGGGGAHATPMCATSQLSASLGASDAGAGNLYRALVITNESGTACHLTGYPGVSLLAADGSGIGDPATREPRSYDQVVLRPGGTASTTLHTLNRQGGCEPASDRLRVYPPGNRASLVIPGEVTDCGDVFTVTPLAPGSAGNPGG